MGRGLLPPGGKGAPDVVGSPAWTASLPPPPGLNVYSMLKHQTLVLTLQTLAFLEEKLLWHDSRYTPLYPFRLPYRDFP